MHNQARPDKSARRDDRLLVLASTSKYRRQLLERLRIPFEAVDPEVDETPLQQRGLPPKDLVRTLAQTKARAAATRYSHAIILGGDQCATIDGIVLGKPGSIDRAVEQLEELAGRTHQLVTALCVIDTTSGHEDTIVDVHDMTLRPLSRPQIRRYVEVDCPVDCAGSYKLESLGVALFEEVSGRDPTAIVGVPLMRLASMLARVGFDVFTHAAG